MMGVLNQAWYGALVYGMIYIDSVANSMLDLPSGNLT